ncbi:K+/H+ antiporter subunit F [Alkanindiges sp. WGS2144]|uniref:K+/H+ antiporter subunit F n=1 Tax=Alkanindiges sp. WGS2144 TaxID=3366808 RepID=UPI0037519C0A
MNWLNTALQISIAAVSFATALCVWRLLIGPSVVDRLLALDTLFLNTTALIIILGLYWHSFVYFEAALLVAMLGFISTTALSRYFTTGHLID